MPNFRDHLPKDCPPADAVEANGEAYRLVCDGRSLEEAFRSHTELGIACPEERKACAWGSVSIFRTRASIEALLNQGGRFKGAKIAVGTLSPDLGVTKDGKSIARAHADFWPFDEASPWEAFEIDESAE